MPPSSSSNSSRHIRSNLNIVMGESTAVLRLGQRIDFFFK